MSLLTHGRAWGGRALGRSLVALVTTACLAASPSSYGAEPAEEARQLFVQGREASRRGELERAFSLFRKSHQIYSTPGTLLNLADCEERLGMVASAWRHYRELAAGLSSTDERAVMATSRAASLEPQVPWLRIDLDGGAPAETRIRVDGTDLPQDQVNREIPLDPGKHVVETTAPGRQERSYALTLPAGARLSLSVGPGDFIMENPKPVTSTSPGVTPPQTIDQPMTQRRLAGLTIGGLGLAGMTTGGILGIMALNANAELDGRCNEKSCPREWLDIQRTRNMLTSISVTSTLLGLAWVSAGTYLALTEPEPRRPVVGGQAIVHPEGVWLGLQGTF